MPRIRLADPSTPFAERLRTGLSYPVRGAGLATCSVLVLSHSVGFLPSWIDAFAAILVGACTWRYAADCLRHTANGYAAPPDGGDEGDRDSSWALTAAHLLVVAMCVLAIVFRPGLLWPALIVAALALPAIDMSLAVDRNLALAINPLNWLKVMHAFGAAYAVPVAINLLLGTLIVAASLSTALLPRLLVLPLFAFVSTCLIVLAFHLMGVMVHQRHERFRVQPDAPLLAQSAGQGEDQRLLSEVETLPKSDPKAALTLLVQRLQDRAVPASLHQAFRRLLHQLKEHDGLLVHGQIWLAALTAPHAHRRAVGLIEECRGINPIFAPDDARSCGELAPLAARLGMHRLAIHLGRSYLAPWPPDPQVPRYRLRVASASATHADSPAEARQLLAELLPVWPEHPPHPELLAQYAASGGAL